MRLGSAVECADILDCTKRKARARELRPCKDPIRSILAMFTCPSGECGQGAFGVHSTGRCPLFNVQTSSCYVFSVFWFLVSGVEFSAISDFWQKLSGMLNLFFRPGMGASWYRRQEWWGREAFQL
jgi:hypothetical protein